ncbi:hypothetical protein Pmani_002791 [Petrolisthes manimaculis]|uniref:Uncharacterized protein n=1 Tax=Petrolisthes manimaculis TaxID=1843537 RepID=A0AAE1QHT5_9EUCA|nr:hypothetical protein Pmani_002791 [Petrolisthes manimaculis]
MSAMSEVTYVDMTNALNRIFSGGFGGHASSPTHTTGMVDGIKAEPVFVGETGVDSEGNDTMFARGYQRGYTGTGGKEKESKIQRLVEEAKGCAVLDSGCSTTVCGADWYGSFIQNLSDVERDSIFVEESTSSFTFGDGVTVSSVMRTLRAAHQSPPTTQTLRAAHQSPPTTQRIFELLTSLDPSTLLSSTLPPTAIRVDDGTHLDSRRQTATAFRPRSILYFLSWLV